MTRKVNLKISFAKLKIAIVHDALIEYGGAEHVLKSLLNLFPNADLYTLYFNTHDKTIREKFGSLKLSTSFFQHIPLLHYLGSYFSITKLYSWLYFYGLDLKKYDLIISSSHSFNSKIVRKNKSALHLCYLYTPPKYLYEQNNELALIKKFPFKQLFYPLFSVLKYIDNISSGHPDIIIAISEEVKKRIKKYYNRDAIVIHPPVANQSVSFIGKRKKEYYVFHSRLVRQKGAELAVETCTKFGLPLKVVGDGYLFNKLKSIAGPTIEFLGFVPTKKIPQIYSRAKALLYCSKDEDFGIVPIEAMSYGVPVIAYKSGAVTETVKDGKTGILFDDWSIKGLFTAIRIFEKKCIYPEACLKNAKKFDEELFNRRLIQVIAKFLFQAKE